VIATRIDAIALVLKSHNADSNAVSPALKPDESAILGGRRHLRDLRLLVELAAVRFRRNFHHAVPSGKPLRALA
jgi:hypothetical protein